MNCDLLTGLIGILGVAIGALIPAWFGYLSEKSEHTRFVKRIRIEKRFLLAEQLIKHIKLPSMAISLKTMGRIDISITCFPTE